MQIYQKEVGRLQLDELETNSLLNLNEEQENALNTINKILDETGFVCFMGLQVVVKQKSTLEKLRKS